MQKRLNEAEFKEATAGPTFDPSKLDIADPPKLAAVPEAEVPWRG